MNIFAVHPDPYVCSKVLDNQRLNKMITETMQMLSTNVYVLWPCDGNFTWSRNAGKLNLPTHQNNRVTKWMRDDYRHFVWTMDYANALHQEWWRRGYASHQTTFNALVLVENIFVVQTGLDLLSVDSPEYFPNASFYKDWNDVHAAYRQTLIDKWRQKGWVVRDDYFDKFILDTGTI